MVSLMYVYILDIDKNTYLYLKLNLIGKNQRDIMIFLFNKTVQHLNGVLLELANSVYGPQSKTYLIEINLNSSCARIRKTETDQGNVIASSISNLIDEKDEDKRKIDANSTILLSTSKGHLIIRTFLESILERSKEKIQFYSSLKNESNVESSVSWCKEEDVWKRKYTYTWILLQSIDKLELNWGDGVVTFIIMVCTMVREIYLSIYPEDISNIYSNNDQNLLKRCKIKEMKKALDFTFSSPLIQNNLFPNYLFPKLLKYNQNILLDKSKINANYTSSKSKYISLLQCKQMLLSCISGEVSESMATFVVNLVIDFLVNIKINPLKPQEEEIISLDYVKKVLYLSESVYKWSNVLVHKSSSSHRHYRSTFVASVSIDEPTNVNSIRFCQQCSLLSPFSEEWNKEKQVMTKNGFYVKWWIPPSSTRDLSFLLKEDHRFSNLIHGYNFAIALDDQYLNVECRQSSFSVKKNNVFLKVTDVDKYQKYILNQNVLAIRMYLRKLSKEYNIDVLFVVGPIKESIVNIGKEERILIVGNLNLSVAKHLLDTFSLTESQETLNHKGNRNSSNKMNQRETIKPLSKINLVQAETHSESYRNILGYGCFSNIIRHDIGTESYLVLQKDMLQQNINSERTLERNPDIKQLLLFAETPGILHELKANIYKCFNLLNGLCINKAKSNDTQYNVHDRSEEKRSCASINNSNLRKESSFNNICVRGGGHWAIVLNMEILHILEHNKPKATATLGFSINEATKNTLNILTLSLWENVRALYFSSKISNFRSKREYPAWYAFQSKVMNDFVYQGRLVEKDEEGENENICVTFPSSKMEAFEEEILIFSQKNRNPNKNMGGSEMKNEGRKELTNTGRIIHPAELIHYIIITSLDFVSTMLKLEDSVINVPKRNTATRKSTFRSKTFQNDEEPVSDEETFNDNPDVEM